MLDLKMYPSNTNEVKNLWSNLVKELNNSKGARKTVDEWKRFLITWKSKTKAKARNLKKEQMGTGGGPSTAPSLNEYEERLMNLIGWSTVEGCALVAPELPPIIQEIEVNSQIQDILLESNTDIEEHIINVLEENEYEPFNSQENIEQSIEPRNIVDDNEPETLLEKSNPKVAINLRNKAKRQNDRASTLETAANVYANSSQKIADSTELIATSLDKLASTITKYAEAIVKVAELSAEQQICKCKNSVHAKETE